MTNKDSFIYSFIQIMYAADNNQNYDLSFPKMGVQNAPQSPGPTSRHMLPPGEYGRRYQQGSCVLCREYVIMSRAMPHFSKLLWPLLTIHSLVEYSLWKKDTAIGLYMYVFQLFSTFSNRKTWFKARRTLWNKTYRNKTTLSLFTSDVRAFWNKTETKRLSSLKVETVLGLFQPH